MKASRDDFQVLAAEVMDLWQEHLTLYAADPNAKAELMRMLEPQRQLFADWSAMMQNGVHGTSATQSGMGSGSSAAASVDAATAKPPRPASAVSASDDGALRLAQLAHRMAELEKRMSKLESRNAGVAKTPRRGKTH